MAVYQTFDGKYDTGVFLLEPGEIWKRPKFQGTKAKKEGNQSQHFKKKPEQKAYIFVAC